MAKKGAHDITVEPSAAGAKERVAAIDVRLERVENAVEEIDARLEEDVARRGDLADVVRQADLATMMEELREQMHGALNVMADTIQKMVQEKLDHVMAGFTVLQEEVKEMKGDWALCKEAALRGSHGPRDLKIVDSFKPKPFDGKREAKELDTFLWNMERYFKHLKLEDEESKISTATLFLTDNALMWWRRRSMEIEQGTFTLTTWNDFKEDIMLHFYPQNAKYEAKEKLRWLRHTGSVKEYVNAFVSLLFEVPSMPEDDKLMYFMSGLQNWARLELQRRQVQNLSQAIAAAESLIEFNVSHPSDSKFKGKRNDEKGGGDTPKEKDKHVEQPESSKPKERRFEKKPEGKTWERKCFLCEGPHLMMDCPQKKALKAMRFQEERLEDGEVARMGSIRLLPTT